MAERLRCGVIGTGAIGCDHLETFSRHPRASVVAFAENNPKTAREASERFRISRSYTDYLELLEQPDIDAVSIALPNHLHAKAALEALKARKHVLLEKPMTLALKDAEKIMELAKKMRRVVMVGQNFRFDPQVQLAKASVERGDLGDVYHVRGFFLRRHGIPRIGSWFTQKQFAGGGCTVDLGSHLLDTCLYLINDFRVTCVAAQMHSRLGPQNMGEMDWGKSEIDPRRPFDVEDYSIALIRLHSGRTVILETSWAGFHAPDHRERSIDLLGSNAGLSLFPARLFRNGQNGTEITHLNGKYPLPTDRIHHFVDCVLDNAKPIITPEQSLKVQEVLGAIYTSAQTGKEVKLKS